MKGQMKKLMAGLGTVLLATAVAAPSFAAKEAISDEELDMVTAAGQPTVLQAIGSSSAAITVSGQTITETTTGATLSGAGTDIALNVDGTSQSALRALTLNNVAGENQVATGLNVAAASLSQGPQTNTITQSWGSAKDFSVSDPVEGGDAADCPIGALICKGDGGAGQQGLRISAYADVIVHAEATAGTATIDYGPSTRIAMDLADGSQSGLAALTVNNVAGLNQVATGTNIFSGAIAIPGTTGITIAAAGSGSTQGGQSNSITQFRGAPVGFADR